MQLLLESLGQQLDQLDGKECGIESIECWTILQMLAESIVRCPGIVPRQEVPVDHGFVVFYACALMNLSDLRSIQ